MTSSIRHKIFYNQLLKIFQLYYNLSYISTNQKYQKDRKRLKKSKDSFHQTFKNKKKEEEEEEGKEDRSRKEQVNSSNKEIRLLLLRRIIKKFQRQQR